MNPPPQFGQTPCRTVRTHSVQKVHSNVQIIASPLSGGRSRSQHSQLGLSASMGLPDRLVHGHELGTVGEGRLHLDVVDHLGDAIHHLVAG